MRKKGKRVLTDQEKDFIRANAGTMTDKQMGQELTNMTGLEYKPSFIANQRRKLGIKKERGRGVCRVQS